MVYWSWYHFRNCILLLLDNGQYVTMRRILLHHQHSLRHAWIQTIFTGGLRDNFAIQVGGCVQGLFSFFFNKFNKFEFSRDSSPLPPSRLVQLSQLMGLGDDSQWLWHWKKIEKGGGGLTSEILSGGGGGRLDSSEIFSGGRRALDSFEILTSKKKGLW